MQAFQPRPLQGGPSSGSNLPSFNSDSVKLVMKVIGVIVLIIIAIFLFSTGKTYSRISPPTDTAVTDRPVGTVFTEEVVVTAPTASERIRLPFYITGTARSNWFTDGIFPVQVFDGKNNLLASTYAIADIAPIDGGVANFRAVIERFDVRPETRIGRIVLHRQVLRDSPRDGDIASIGVDFTDIGLSAQKASKTQTSTSTTTTSDSKIKYTSGVSSFTSTTSDSKPATNTTTPPASNNTQVPPPAGPYTCNDGIDNDRDQRLDSEDPDCHTDGYPTNNASYDGNRDEHPVVPTVPAQPNNNSGTGSSGSVWTRQQWLPE